MEANKKKGISEASATKTAGFNKSMGASGKGKVIATTRKLMEAP